VKNTYKCSNCNSIVNCHYSLTACPLCNETTLTLQTPPVELSLVAWVKDTETRANKVKVLFTKEAK
jgi:hypothetical protein